MGRILSIVFLMNLVLAVMLLNNVAISYEYDNFLIIIILGFAFAAIPEVIKFDNDEKSNVKFYIGAIMLVIVALIIGKSAIFTADELKNSVTVKSVESVNITGQLSVTLGMANKIANKVLGEKHNGVQVSSQYEINLNMASVQMKGSELVWVLPLDYSGFFKWLNQDWIPGYVLVSATEPNQKAELVLDYKIKVSNNAYFLENVDRMAYVRSGFRDVDVHFEIDDNGKPYYIASVQIPNTLYTNFSTSKVFVIDAQTAEIQEFENGEEVKSALPWVDRVISENYTEDKINYYGSLQDGWLNSMFTQTNINKTTDYKGQELWLVNVGGNVHYFTGMTSVNAKDQSLVTGILVNAITGDALEVPLSGVMDENGAVSVLDSGLGSDSIRWEPVLPMPFFIDGEFYWGSSIVSDSGIFQKVGIVKGNDQSKVFYAKTFNEAVEKARNGSVNTSDDANEMVLVNKKVLNEILAKITELEKLKAQLQ